MASQGKPLPRELREAIARDLKAGMPRGQVAQKHGVARYTVTRIAQRLFGPAPRGKRPLFDAEKRSEARELFLAGEPAARIALAVGCSEETVRRWAIDYGWREELARRRQAPEHLEAEIARLSALISQAGDGKATQSHQHNHFTAVVDLMEDESLQRVAALPFLAVHIIDHVERCIGPILLHLFKERDCRIAVSLENLLCRCRNGVVFPRTSKRQSHSAAHLRNRCCDVPCESAQCSHVGMNRLGE